MASLIPKDAPIHNTLTVIEGRKGFRYILVVACAGRTLYEVRSETYGTAARALKAGTDEARACGVRSFEIHHDTEERIREASATMQRALESRERRKAFAGA